MSLSEYGIGTTADPNMRRRFKKCFMCGRFVPQVPEGWEIVDSNSHEQDKGDDRFEYGIQVHDCPCQGGGSEAQRLIKRRRKEK